MGVSPRVAPVLETLLPVGPGTGSCSELGMDRQHGLHTGVPGELLSSPSRRVPQFWAKSGRQALGGVGQALGVGAAGLPTRHVDDLVGATPVRGNDWGAAGESL